MRERFSSARAHVPGPRACMFGWVHFLVRQGTEWSWGIDIFSHSRFFLLSLSLNVSRTTPETATLRLETMRNEETSFRNIH